MSEWKTTPSSDLALTELQDEIGRLHDEIGRLTNELAVERARSSEAREEEARQKRVDETARAAFVAMDCSAERAYSFALDLERARDAYVGSRQAILKAADHRAQRAQSATSSASSGATRTARPERDVEGTGEAREVPKKLRKS